MVVGEHRNTIVKVDLTAIRANVADRVARLNPDQELFAVVKADGYGHGMVAVARAAQQAGAKGFCVAILDEALALREEGFEEPILILGVSRVVDAVLIAEHQISQTVSSIEWLQEAVKVLKTTDCQQPMRIHLALDTGMGRIGCRTIEEVRAVEEYIQKHPNYFELEGTFTHFAKADDSDTNHVEKQVLRYKELLAAFSKRPRYCHCSNSAWAIWHHPEISSIVRYGIAMYGVNPSNGEWEVPFTLKPSLSWETEIAFVKQLHKGDTISYGATYTCQEDEWIATLPVGYADGWLRSYHTMAVLVEGERCPIVGRICMDQCMIRLPYHMPAGTKVTLIGQNGRDEITAEEVSHHGNTIGYEVLCGISSRVPRVYIGQ